MAIENINVGTNPNDGTGDSLRTSFIICNNNFSYLNSVVSGNGIVSANSLSISGNVLLGQSLSFSAPSANLQYGGTANTYVQMVMQNKSSLTNASTDYVVTADNGNDSAFFGDFGIASSTYYYAGYESILPNDTYLISNGGNLLLNAGSTGKSVKFVAGGSGTSAIVGEFSNTALTVSPTTISSSTSSGALQVAGGAGIGGNLYVGGDVHVTSTTISSDTSSGALQVSGGVGIAGNLYVGGNISATLVTATQPYITSVGNLTSLSLTTGSNVSGANGFNITNLKSITYTVASLIGSNTTAITANLVNNYHSRIALDVNANITISYSSSIDSGSEKHIFIRNVNGSSTANIILPNSNNNKGTNVIPISAGTVASVMLLSVDTTEANVMATIINS